MNPRPSVFIRGQSCCPGRRPNTDDAAQGQHPTTPHDFNNMLDTAAQPVILSVHNTFMGGGMVQAQNEQRGTRRFSLRLPVTVKYDDTHNAETVATTKDVSARGVFFYL